MRLKRIYLFISTIGCSVVLGAVATQAQTAHQSFDPHREFSCPDLIVVGQGIRLSNVCPSYDKKRTCAGDQDVPLSIAIYSDTGGNGLKLKDVSLGEGGSDQKVPITFRQAGGPVTKQTEPPGTEYNYTMNLSRDLKARTYQIKLDLQYLNETAFPRYFWLRVCSNNGIKVSDDSPKEIKGLTGNITSLKLKLSNAFELYPINLREIRITSNPSNLIHISRRLIG